MAFTIDGPNRLISLTPGTVAITVPALYSAWVDWVATSDNAKFLPAFRTVGGDDVDLAAGTKVPPYCYLINGWRIRPQEANHTLNVSGGILLVDGGGDPFVNTLGSFVVRINYSQPVQAITVSTGGGSAPTAEQNATAMWAALLEGVPAGQQIAIIRAALVGKTTGIGTPTERYRDADDTKDRIVATFDAAGNRLSVTLDGA